MFVSSLPWRYSHQRLQTHKFGANFTSTKLRVYLVVVDICIVDCHMLPGSLAPQVLYSNIYTGRGLNAIHQSIIRIYLSFYMVSRD